MNNKDISWKNVNSLNGNHTSKALGYYRPCPICGSLESKVVMELDDFQFYSDSTEEPKRFDVRETICLACFTLYLNPCYSNHGFSVLFKEAGQSYGSIIKHTKEQIGWLNENNLLNDDFYILDVGCYDGNFLSLLPDRVKKLGVDIDEVAIKRGRERYKEKNIQFILGDFETFSYHDVASLPDTITMYHVLEHLPRPVEVLKKLHSIAKTSTRLVIEVPILENGKTNDINSFFSIQHMTHFSRNSLCSCLAIAGWEIIKDYETADYNGYRVLASRVVQQSVDKIRTVCFQKDWAELNANLAFRYMAILEVEKVIQQMQKCEKIVIWGGGAHTEYLYHVTSLFHAHHSNQFIIVDKDPIKHGKTWRGIYIYDSSILTKLDWSSTILIISSYSGQASIVDSLEQLDVPDDKIVRLYKTVNRY